MAKSKYITRKEIANANELSDDTIARRERKLGLSSCRDRACDRPVRYDRECAESELRRRGYKVPE